MKYRISALILCVVLALSIVFTFGVAAQAETSAVITVENTAGAPGSTVEVDVTLTGNPGILGMTLNISWAEGLTLINDQNGEALGALNYQAPKRYNSAGTNFVWYGTDVDEVLDGTVLTLTFKIDEEALDGELYEIDVTSKGVYDADRQPVALECVGGSVLVRNYIPGDASGEGFVDPLDLIMLAQYISDNCTTDPEGYNVSINENAADVDDTGTLDPLDLILLSQFISDGCITDPDSYNVVLKPSLPRCAHTELAVVEAREATCTENGNIAYWYCASCNKCFSDASAKTVIRLSDTVVEAGTHTAIVQISAKAPTCTEDGNIAYWYCSDCGKNFADAEGEVELSNAATVVGATGHGNLSATPEKIPTYTEPGNIAYWYCGTCNKYFKDAEGTIETTLADTVLSVLEVKYHTITYRNLQGAESPAVTQFAEHLGLAFEDVPKPVRTGYDFDGWYTESKGGTPVDEIKAGTTENVVVYAHWTAKKYTITYRDVIDDAGKTKEYTIEDAFEIYTPEWRHLTFSHWEDQSGKLEAYNDATGKSRLRVKAGTTGNIELVAKWKSPESLIIPKTENQISAGGYDEELGIHWFIYELGTIKNVVLDANTSKTYDHSGSSRTLTTSESLTIDEGWAEEISSSYAKTVTSSTNWSDMEQWSEEVSAEAGVSVTTGIEATVGKEGIAQVSGKLEYEVSCSLGASAAIGGEAQTGGANENGTEEAKELGSTLTYNKQMTYTEETSTTLDSSDPDGHYQYVHVSDVNVFAAVIYNPVTKTYGVNIFSKMGDMRTHTLYRPFEEEYNMEFVNGSLSYNIDKTLIESTINSMYYVSYNANGGEYNEVTKEHKIAAYPAGQAMKPSATIYTKTGYKLSGWYDGVNGQGNYYAVDVGTTLRMDPGETVTLYADWTPVTYTITYNANGGSLSGSYTTKYTVESEKIVLPTPTYNTYSKYNHFAGWYLDKNCSILYTSDYKTNPRNVELFAKWDLCAVYNSIDSTPWSVSGRVIIDWSGESDTNLLNHTNRAVAGGRYNNLDILKGATEVIFIGDPNKTYTNFVMHLCEFADGQKLTIRFENFKFVANRVGTEDYAAIGTYQDKGVHLTIDVIGTCSIGTSYTAGSIIGSAESAIKNVTFTGSGTLNMTAGNGVAATTTGGNGSNGGTAIFADNVTVDMKTGILKVAGGAGGNGANGTNGSNGQGQGDGSWWSSSDGGDGTDGGNGGNGGRGGYAIKATKIQVKVGNVYLVGGNGGSGGNGGKGGNGGRGANADAVGATSGNGGDGGNGGKGGNAYAGSAATNVAVDTANGAVCDCTTGNSGKVGSGGSGGSGGEAGNADWWLSSKGDEGDDGKAGSAGSVVS